MNQTLTIIRRHWLPLLGWNSLMLVATICAAIYAARTFTPVWKSNAQLNLPQTTNDLNASLGTLGSLQNKGINFNDVNPLQIQLSILNSDVVMAQVLATDSEKDLYPSLASYKKLFEMTPQDESTTIAVEATGSRPDLAYKRVNTLLEVYQKRLNELRHGDVGVREQFTQEEMEKARRDLNEAQTNLAKFQQSTGLTAITEQTKGLIASIHQLRSTEVNLVAEAQAYETQAKVAAARFGITPNQALNSLHLGENKEYQALREKVSEVDTLLADVRAKYTETSPQVQSLLSRRQELMQALNQQLVSAVPNANTTTVDRTLGGSTSKDSRIEMIANLIQAQTTAQGLRQQAHQIQNQVNKLRGELSFITANQAQLSDLQRRYEIAEGVYKAIIAQTQQAKTNPFSVYPNIQVIDEPNIYPELLAPRFKLIAVGGILAALSSSIALVLFLENRHPLLQPQDLQQMEFPVLGRIARLKRPDIERDLRAEMEIEFQRLASAVLMQEKPCLMVTSATAGEGKTTVTLGLALALVNFGFRVLVVDGDLRQASLGQRLGHARTKLSTSGQQTPLTVTPGLDLMPAPAIPNDKISEFFARGGFQQYLNAVRDSGEYDYVLVDSAPVGLASETNLMSAIVCQVLFVIRSGISDRYSVIDSLAQLTRHNAQIMGLVVNGVESTTIGYRYYGSQRELVEAEV